jgi:ubiquinone/menaquinone biosynthesis C-methylase UbiE
MRRFLRRSAVERDALPVAMSGARMGERLLQIGLDDARVAAALGAKPGLSGESALVVADQDAAASMSRAVARTGALVNVHVHALDQLPFDDGSFDVVVVHDRGGQLAALDDVTRAGALTECRRVLRSGGRIVVLGQGTPTGVLARLKGGGLQPQPADWIVQRLEQAGFRAVRELGDREGYRFVEGLRT